MAFTPLARTGWSITADSTGFGLSVGNAIDGNLSTFWHSDTGYPHSLVIDMGSAQTFNAVQFVPRSDGTRTDPAGVEVYVSDDGSTWGSAVASVTWIHGPETKVLAFASVTKRWVKFQGTSGADNAYMACTEIYVGTDSFTPLPRSGWSVTADSVFSGSFLAVNAIDSNFGSFWHSDTGYPHSLVIDMGSAQNFNAIQFVPRSDGTSTDPANVEVYVSDDGSTWGAAVASATWTSDASIKVLAFSAVTKRWLKFQGVTGAVNAFMACTELYIGTVAAAVTTARVTQLAVEVLAGPGSPKARITQLAVETLVGPAGGNARLTQLAVEALVSLAAPAAEIRETQAVLEPVEYPLNSILLTQEALEEVTYPPNELRVTQEALENVEYPPNALWATQVALEVVLKGEFIVERYNHSFIGAWMATGGKKNASFAI